MNSKAYQDILEEVLFPIYDPGTMFQQDNAPIHNSKDTMEFLSRNGIWTIDCPPYSPDLNPIEHVWAACDLILI